MQFDDEGNFVKPAPRAGKLDGDANVVVVERQADETADATTPATGDDDDEMLDDQEAA